jgi:tripartite-type tricarboxylate transporter receptor subunit TctC
MNAELANALRNPGVNEKLVAQGLVKSLSQPQEPARFVCDEVERRRRVVRENRITAGD